MTDYKMNEEEKESLKQSFRDKVCSSQMGPSGWECDRKEALEFFIEYIEQYTARKVREALDSADTFDWDRVSVRN